MMEAKILIVAIVMTVKILIAVHTMNQLLLSSDSDEESFILALNQSIPVSHNHFLINLLKEYFADNQEFWIEKAREKVQHHEQFKAVEIGSFPIGSAGL